MASRIRKPYESSFRVTGRPIGRRMLMRGFRKQSFLFTPECRFEKGLVIRNRSVQVPGTMPVAQTGVAVVFKPILPCVISYISYF
jgi:hypothetical protein